MTHRNDLITSDAETVTLSDTALKRYAGLYVGTTGNLKVTTIAGTDITFTSVPAGMIIPLGISRVWSTGTTASNIIGFFN